MSLSLALLLAVQEPPFGFSGLEVYLGDANAHSLAVADFNGDRLTDFALVNAGRARIEVFLQKTAAQVEADRARPPRFDEQNQIADDARFAKEMVPLDRALNVLVAADLDGAGGPELVGVGAAPLSLVAYARGERGWERAAEHRLPSGQALDEGARCLAVRGDRVVLLLADRVQVYRWADGRFRIAEDLVASIENPTGMELCDLDGDGTEDLACFRTSQENGLSVRFGREGGFGPEHVFRTGMMRSVGFARLPGRDATSLIAVTDPSGRLAAFDLTVVLLERAELADLPAYIGLTASRNRIATVGDLNGDSRADLVLANPDQATLDVLLGDPHATFATARTFPTYAGVASLCIAGGALYVASPDEAQIGRYRWSDAGLGSPEPLANLPGKPQAVAAVADAGDPIAVLYTARRGGALEETWGLAHGDAAETLLSLREAPVRFFAADIARDGEVELVIVPRRDPPLLVLRRRDRWMLANTTPYADMLRRAEEASFSAVDSYWATEELHYAERSGLLYVKQNFARVVHLDTNGQLQVDLQITAPAGVNLKNAVLLGADRALLYDGGEAKRFLLVVKEDAGWRTERAIPLSQAPVQIFQTPDIVWLAERAVGILPQSTTRRELSISASYESEAREAQLSATASGDLNGDGRTDLVVFDAKNRTLELLRAGDGSISKGITFEMFEQAERRPIRVRAMTAADLTGDGKDDLLALVHDRILLYVQE